MYHNMMMEHENQCVIIRLVPNKLIMVQVVFNYKGETGKTHGGCRNHRPDLKRNPNSDRKRVACNFKIQFELNFLPI